MPTIKIAEQHRFNKDSNNLLENEDVGGII